VHLSPFITQLLPQPHMHSTMRTPLSVEQPASTLSYSPQTDARELSGFTPAFLWLLRDFYLKLEDEQGHQVGFHWGHTCHVVSHVVNRRHQRVQLGGDAFARSLPSKPAGWERRVGKEPRLHACVDGDPQVRE
jgi:hypothetical protein